MTPRSRDAGRTPASLDAVTDPGSPIVGAEGRLAELCGHLATVRRYPKGVFVYQQGEVSDRFYRLVSGRVRLYFSQPDGREQVVAIIEPGALFGEAACFDELPNYMTALTVQPSTVQVFARDAVLKAMRGRPEVSREIIRSITRKQRLLTLQLQTATFRKAPARVAFVLSRLAASYGVTVAGGRSTRIGLHLSHEELASMIGVTRVTVTREVGTLIREGIITRDGRHLIVLRSDRLLERTQLS